MIRGLTASTAGFWLALSLVLTGCGPQQCEFIPSGSEDHILQTSRTVIEGTLTTSEGAEELTSKGTVGVFTQNEHLADRVFFWDPKGRWYRDTWHSRIRVDKILKGNVLGRTLDLYVITERLGSGFPMGSSVRVGYDSRIGNHFYGLRIAELKAER
jgi:hypothetical protein